LFVAPLLYLNNKLTVHIEDGYFEFGMGEFGDDSHGINLITDCYFAK